MTSIVNSDIIMKMQNKKIKVHKVLGEFFGRETTRFDLLAIVISAVSFAGMTLLLIWSLDFSVLKKIVLTILALDIGGGVVANFTIGTNNYYAESLRKRYLFIFFHLLQPSILIWIFPNELLSIVIATLFILTSSILVLGVKKQYHQRIVAITLLLLYLILSTSLNYTDTLTQITMQLFSIKLILAFSVNWASTDNDEIRTENKTTPQ